jgi:hypothetical protein
MVSDTSSTTAELPYRFVRPRNSTDATRFLPCARRYARLSFDISCTNTIHERLFSTYSSNYEPVNAGLRFSMKALRPST